MTYPEIEGGKPNRGGVFGELFRPSPLTVVAAGCLGLVLASQTSLSSRNVPDNSSWPGMKPLPNPTPVYESYDDSQGNEPTTVRVDYTQGRAIDCRANPKAEDDYWQLLANYKPTIIGTGSSSEGNNFAHDGWVVQKTGDETFNVYTFTAAKPRDINPLARLLDPLELDQNAVAYADGKADVTLDDLRSGVNYFNDESSLRLSFEQNPNYLDTTQYDLHMEIDCN